MVKCHILQPKENMKQGLYVYLSEIWSVCLSFQKSVLKPTELGEDQGPHSQHEQEKHPLCAPVPKKLLLKKNKQTLLRTCFSIPQAWEEATCLCRMYPCSRLAFQQYKALILIPSEFSQAAGEAKLQKWSQVSFQLEVSKLLTIKLNCMNKLLNGMHCWAFIQPSAGRKREIYMRGACQRPTTWESRALSPFNRNV